MDKHQERLYEIKFNHLINEFFKNSPNAESLYTFIDTFGLMFACNRIQLRQATITTICNEQTISPSPAEYVVLLVLVDGHSIRNACAKANIASTNTYYSALDKLNLGQLNVAPRYPEKQRDAIIKCIQGLEELLNYIF